MKAIDTTKTIERRIVFLIKAKNNAINVAPQSANDLERKYHLAIHQMYQIALDLGLTISGTRIDRMLAKKD